jgi:hypothetical protein
MTGYGFDCREEHDGLRKQRWFVQRVEGRDVGTWMLEDSIQEKVGHLSEL